MTSKNLEDKIDALKASLDTLILIELCKNGVKRDEAREILGSLGNSAFAKVNKVISNKS